MPVWVSIQYLRGFAALGVVWIHSYLQLEKIAPVDEPWWFNGRSGVDLFFVISGFIIWITTHDDRSRPGAFWRRRLIRVVPLYWLCTCAMVLLLLALPSVFERPHLEIWHIVQSLLFIPHFDPFQAGQIYPLLPVGWTLNYEFFFYASFGIALLLPRDHRAAMMFAWFGGLVLCGAIFRPDGAVMATYTDPILLEFVAGMLIGYGCTRSNMPKAIVGWGLIVASIGSYIALNHGIDVPHKAWRTLCWGVPATLLIAGAVIVERNMDIRRIAALHLLGDASYAIYLSHLFVLGAIGWIWARFMLPPSAFIAAAMLVSVAGGILLHVLVEKPLVRCLRSESLRSRSWVLRPYGRLTGHHLAAVHGTW